MQCPLSRVNQGAVDTQFFPKAVYNFRKLLGFLCQRTVNDAGNRIANARIKTGQDIAVFHIVGNVHCVYITGCGYGGREPTFRQAHIRGPQGTDCPGYMNQAFDTTIDNQLFQVAVDIQDATFIYITLDVQCVYAAGRKVSSVFGYRAVNSNARATADNRRAVNIRTDNRNQRPCPLDCKITVLIAADYSQTSEIAAHCDITVEVGTLTAYAQHQQRTKIVRYVDVPVHAAKHQYQTEITIDCYITLQVRRRTGS